MLWQQASRCCETGPVEAGSRHPGLWQSSQHLYDAHRRRHAEDLPPRDSERQAPCCALSQERARVCVGTVKICHSPATPTSAKIIRLKAVYVPPNADATRS